MNAAEVKEALRRRHPALADGMAGPWTCIEEWMNVDLLAVSAWASVRPFPRYARVGYEVKVSRSDYKRELAKPGKRALAVAFCHEFYIAVPHGLLKEQEIRWEPPPGFDDFPPFTRRHCPGAFGAYCLNGRLGLGRGVQGRRFRSGYGTPHEALSRESQRAHNVGWWDRSRGRHYEAPCPTCRGAGWIVDSPAVRAGAPPLWIPDDVGLVVVYPEGRTVVAKKAPRRKPAADTGNHGAYEGGVRLSDQQIADLIRWVSVRPDRRHGALGRHGSVRPTA